MTKLRTIEDEAENEKTMTMRIMMRTRTMRS